MWLAVWLTATSKTTDNKAIIGYWKLVGVQSGKLLSRSDEKINKLMRDGFYTTYIIFRNDSTFTISMYQQGRLVKEDKGRYFLSADGKFLNSVGVGGQKSRTAVQSLTNDTLKLRYSSGQLSIYAKMKE